MPMKRIISRLDDAQRQRLGEVLRFGVVGGLATALQYGVYLLLLPYMGELYAMSVGYGVSFVFNYLASTYFTFRVEASAKRGLGFALAHGVNYLLQLLCLSFFVWIGISARWAPLPMFAVCVPINFVLVRTCLKRW